MRIALLLITLLLAVGLSAFMWMTGIIPFNLRTSALHVVSIYIGVSGVLAFQRTKLGRHK